MDYTTLVAGAGTDGSIKNWVNKSTVPSTTVLTEAEAWIYRRLRVRQMLTNETGTMSTSNDYVSLPSDYIADRKLRITGTNAAEIKRKTLEYVEDLFAYDASGTRVSEKPAFYYNSDTRSQFPNLPDQAYAYRRVYYGVLDALSASNLTNFLTDRAPMLLRAACMMSANAFLKDDAEKTYWEEQALKEVAVLNIENDFEQRDLDAAVVVV